MAGRRHHFIPQFLQRGFSSHCVGEEFYTWVYRKGSKEAFNTNIKNVGIEGDFYSIDLDPTLDNTITEAEKKFGIFVNQLRADSHINDIDVSIAARLIAHLETRTRNLRQLFISAGSILVDEMIKFINDPYLCEQFIRKEIKSELEKKFKDEVIQSLIDKKVPKTLIPLYLSPLLKALPDQVNNAMPGMLENMGEMAAYLKNNLPTLLNTSAKAGHIKALNANISPPIKVQRYEQLKYFLLDSKNPLLGDSAVVFKTYGERSYKPFIDSEDELEAVILPISSDKILIGATNDQVNFLNLDIAIASCSLEYFITPKNNETNNDLSALISTNAFMLNNSEIEALMSGMLKN